MPAGSELAEVTHAWTDGSTRPRNPGYGGAAHLIVGQKVYLGAQWMGAMISNNKAELQAIWNCLLHLQRLAKTLPEILPAVIHSDSEWAICSITGVYQAHKNREYLDPIVALVDGFEGKVSFEWCRGHSDDPYNNFCDKLARLSTLIPSHKVIQEFTREQFAEQAKLFLEQQEKLVELL